MSDDEESPPVASLPVIPAASLSAPFIARPIATSLLALGLVLIGLLGYRLLPVAALPQVDFPTIQVTTQFPGASAETMASLVTTPLERQFGLIAGLSTMTSVSSYGTSAITLQFDLSKSIDVAPEDVQAAIDTATLPSDLPYPPTYSKVNPAEQPILTLALTSDTLPMTEVNNVADTLLAQKLSQVTGVGRVMVEGGQRPAFRIQLDPARLAAYNLSLDEVRTTLANANVNLAKGTFDGAHQSVSIGANDQISDPEQYRDLIIAYRNSAPVRVRDVGQVIQALENAKVGGWFDGKPAVIVDIQRQPGANIVATVDLVKKILPTLTQAIPAGVKISLLADRTQTIRSSVNDVQFTLALTVGLVILVIFLFLRSGRATIIPGVALPLSLIVTLSVMALCGFSLDNLSLMALTISTGFVVDDAIVMIENIVRYIENGEKPMAAAFKGAKEIGFTVISLTVSLVAVFIPLLFMSGIVGRLFREFALTLTVAVVASCIVSLTLTPMMCGHMLKPTSKAVQSGRFFQIIKNLYERSLTVVMRHQFLTLMVALATMVGTIWLYIVIPKGFLPTEDTGLIVATVDARDDISFDGMVSAQAQVARIIREDPDVSAVASFLGTGTVNPTPNSGHLSIVLKPRKERQSIATGIITRLAGKLANLPGIDVHMQASQDIQIGSRSSRTQYQYALMDVDAKELAQWTPRLLEAFQSLPELSDVASDQSNGGLQVTVAIDRDKASRLGVTMETIDNTLYDAFGQRQITTIYSQVNQYHVILEVSPKFQEDIDALSKLYMRSSNDTLVPLSAIATLEKTTVPLAITHQAQFSSATLSFNLAAGHSLGDAIDVINVTKHNLGVPDTILGGFSGDAAEFSSSLSDEPLLILAAAVVIYIVLGVLYESTIHPITILSTLPSAGVGALVALLITGEDLSLVGLIGIILLMGIVKKNAIMMIDFALEAERVQGKSPDEAIFQACLLRFRPIMMTTMAALLGAVPLAFDQGMGSELRRPLGISIVGGLLLSQLLTLYTTPVVYLYMDRLKALLTRSRPSVVEEN